MFDRKRLGEILVELQVLTPAEVDRVMLALRRRGGMAKFGQIAKEMGYVNEEHILAALAVQMQLLPGIEDMSLSKLMGRLTAPVDTPPRLPVGKLRTLLKRQFRTHAPQKSHSAK